SCGISRTLRLCSWSAGQTSWPHTTAQKLKFGSPWKATQPEPPKFSLSSFVRSITRAHRSTNSRFCHMMPNRSPPHPSVMKHFTLSHKASEQSSKNLPSTLYRFHQRHLLSETFLV